MIVIVYDCDGGVMTGDWWSDVFDCDVISSPLLKCISGWFNNPPVTLPRPTAAALSSPLTVCGSLWCQPVMSCPESLQMLLARVCAPADCRRVAGCLAPLDGSGGSAAAPPQHRQLSRLAEHLPHLTSPHTPLTVSPHQTSTQHQTPTQSQVRARPLNNLLSWSEEWISKFVCWLFIFCWSKHKMIEKEDC